MSVEPAPPTYTEAIRSIDVTAPTSQYCPPGLESLTTLNLIKVEQMVTFNKNEYLLKTSTDHGVFYAKETTSTFESLLLGSRRGFSIQLQTPDGRAVAECLREVHAGFECCEESTVVVKSTLTGKSLGTIDASRGCCDSSFVIHDENGQVAFTMDCSIPGMFEAEFDVRRASDSGQLVAKISKVSSGLVREIFTNANEYHIEFIAALKPE